ncbi:MAG: DUF2207 domain-containing protein, partial [Christensenellaceae bacterium]
MKRKIFAAFAALCLSLIAFLPFRTVTAKADGAYSFNVDRYDVTMQMHADHSFHVTEIISVTLTGWDSHGIIRDIAIGNGEYVYNVKATCDNSDFYYEATTEDDEDYLSVYLRGSAVATGQSRTYTLDYDLSVPNQSNPDGVTIDIVPYGWETALHNVTATILYDEDIRSALEAFEIVSGGLSSTSNKLMTVDQQYDRIVMTAKSLPARNGVTIESRFVSGTLATRPDTPLVWAIVIAICSVGAVLVVLLFFFRQRQVIPVVSFSAPEGMDPLLVGKYIDNSVNNEDLTSLIYYWADKGYLTIDFSDQNNPALQKIAPLPPDAPAHQRKMFEGRFAKSDNVRIQSLQNRF